MPNNDLTLGRTFGAGALSLLIAVSSVQLGEAEWRKAPEAASAKGADQQNPVEEVLGNISGLAPEKLEDCVRKVGFEPIAQHLAAFSFVAVMARYGVTSPPVDNQTQLGAYIGSAIANSWPSLDSASGGSQPAPNQVKAGPLTDQQLRECFSYVDHVLKYPNSTPAAIFTREQWDLAFSLIKRLTPETPVCTALTPEEAARCRALGGIEARGAWGQTLGLLALISATSATAAQELYCRVWPETRGDPDQIVCDIGDAAFGQWGRNKANDLLIGMDKACRCVDGYCDSAIETCKRKWRDIKDWF